MAKHLRIRVIFRPFYLAGDVGILVSGLCNGTAKVLRLDEEGEDGDAYADDDYNGDDDNEDDNEDEVNKSEGGA